MTNYYMDTEFAEDGKTIELISLAIVCEDGREFYAVSSEFHHERCNDWVCANVLPNLPPCTCSRARHDVTDPIANVFRYHNDDANRDTGCRWWKRYQIAQAVAEFIKPDEAIDIWTYFGSYDWVVFCQLFGPMIKLPKHLPMVTMDLKQYAIQLGIRESLQAHVPHTIEHDALEDARWNMAAHKWLEEREREVACNCANVPRLNGHADMCPRKPRP